MMHGGTASWHANGFAIGRRLDGWFAREVRGEGHFLLPTLRVESGDDGYLITAVIPDSEKEELTVSIDDDRLRIAGEHRREHVERHRERVQSERTFSHFTRETRLQRPVDPLRSSARFAGGVLTIELPFAPGETAAGGGPKIVRVTST